MTPQELSSLTASYLQSGGQIKHCAEGDNAVRLQPRNLWQCQCGCHGDFTEHSMRAGESGRCSSIIIR